MDQKKPCQIWEVHDDCSRVRPCFIRCTQIERFADDIADISSISKSTKRNMICLVSLLYRYTNSKETRLPAKVSKLCSPERLPELPDPFAALACATGTPCSGHAYPPHQSHFWCTPKCVRWRRIGTTTTDIALNPPSLKPPGQKYVWVLKIIRPPAKNMFEFWKK